MIDVSISYRQSSRNVRDALGRFAKFSSEALTAVLEEQAKDIREAIEKNLSGGVLNVWSGDLRNAIRVDVVGAGKSQSIRVEYGDAPYGAYHERYERPTNIRIAPKYADKLFIPVRPGVKAGQPGLTYGEDFFLTANPVTVRRAPFIKPAIEEVLPGKNVIYEREFSEAWRKAFGG